MNSAFVSILPLMFHPSSSNPISSWGFYRWGLDLAGPMNLTNVTGNKYVMVLVDYFTEAVALSDKLAATTA